MLERSRQCRVFVLMRVGWEADLRQYHVDGMSWYGPRDPLQLLHEDRTCQLATSHVTSIIVSLDHVSSLHVPAIVHSRFRVSKRYLDDDDDLLVDSLYQPLDECMTLQLVSGTALPCQRHTIKPFISLMFSRAQHIFDTPFQARDSAPASARSKMSLHSIIANLPPN